MKNILFIFYGLCWSITLVNAQGIVFETSKWEEIKALAKAENKLIFVDIYASWCEPCKWMDNNTFKDKAVGEFFKDNYVACKMDIDRGEGITFAEDYKVLTYPTLLFFDSEGVLVHRIIGMLGAKEFLEKTKAALDPNNQVYTLKKTFDAGDKSLSFLYQYITALHSIRENYTSVVDLYLKELGYEGLLNDNNFEFLERFVDSYNHDAYRYVIQHKAKFVSTYSLERVDNYLDAAFRKRCYELVDNASNKTEIRAFHQDVKEILPNRSDYFKTRMDFYLNRGNGRKDFRMAKKYEKHCTDAKSLNALARYIIEIHGKSTTHLEAALEWGNKAVMMDENIYTLETKAMALMGLGKQTEALEVAEKQLALSEEKDEYIAETKALIKKIKAM